MPFASSVSISGNGTNPTFSWTVQGGNTPNAVRLSIFDGANNIHFIDLPGNTTAYTIPSILSTGQTLIEGHKYSFQISLIQTRDGSSSITGSANSNILTRSRSFFNFTPLTSSSPPNVYLPIVTPGPRPVYSFNTTVIQGQTIFIDPSSKAIGYDYAIGNGDPNFASVTLPTGIGDNIYSLYLFDGTNYIFGGFISGGETYSFNAGGLDRFRILGIETSADIDPNNATAFVTGLTFTGSGTFTGTMTPIVLLPVYRFFNMNAGGHFYTIDENEKNTVIQNYKWFRPEGIGFLASPIELPGTLPVYRFFNTIAGGHFYTIDENEKNTVIQNYKWFRPEGIGFYASPTEQPGTLPVYRFFNTIAGGHFYTIDEAEKNTVIQNYKWFRPEGIGFYAYPPDANIVGTWKYIIDQQCTGSTDAVHWWIIKADGTVSTDNWITGTWTVNGNQVTVTLNIGYTYTGTVAGTHMSGTYAASGQTGCWSAEEQ